ncbi:hypothetical protein VTL71DRAFT_3273 [Oculimacula yallundae]|uniref:Uncharacterized protein n=1 Tax=Oculimacula yallundae TaxID=86028 RepID=A0ABR4C8V7_9HELO
MSHPPSKTSLNRYLLTPIAYSMTPSIGRKMGMSLDDFTAQAYSGLVASSSSSSSSTISSKYTDEIIIGGPEPRDVYLDIVVKRRELMEGLAEMMRMGMGAGEKGEK